ncbi:hypothetical protein cyc_08540 [Cyclospora cayetanensis]|uniref:Uncharacterized protein n=1 Tax=Cyclospora cayetanensis TaxID=88456 RepID=A0A1D3CSB9_9EIME|nr:hypothetical protein cyc_08540 [Cyclospora cayetanensis]
MDDLICVPDIGGLEERLLTRTEKRARAARRLLEAAEANNTQRVLTLLKDEADPTAELQQRLLQEQHRSQSEKYQGKYSSAELPQENTSSPTRVTPVDGTTTEGGAVERPAAQSLAATEAAAPQQQQQEAEPHQAAQPLELEPLPAPSALSDVIATKEASADSKEQPLPILQATRKYSPLHWAAYKGATRIFHVLLKAGFSPHVMDSLGNTEEDCRALLDAATAAESCPLTGIAFSSRHPRFFCSFTLDFYSKAARDTEDYPLDCRLGKLLKTETKRLAIEAQIRRILKLVEAEKQHQRQQENTQDVQEDAALKLEPDRLSKPLEGEGGQREENELPPETGEPSNKHDPQHMLQLDLQDDSQLMDELASLVIEGVAACCNSTLMQQLQHCRRLLVAEKNLKDLLRCLRRSNECPEPSFYERLCLSWEETRAISSEPELLEEAAAEASRAARHILLQELCVPLEPLRGFTNWTDCRASPIFCAFPMAVAFETAATEFFESQLLTLQEVIYAAREAGVPLNTLQAAESLCHHMEFLLIDAKRTQEEARLNSCGSPPVALSTSLVLRRGTSRQFNSLGGSPQSRVYSLRHDSVDCPPCVGSGQSKEDKEKAKAKAQKLPIAEVTCSTQLNNRSSRSDIHEFSQALPSEYPTAFKPKRIEFD